MIITITKKLTRTFALFMKKSNKNIKKLVKQTFEKYSISKVTPDKIKEVINAQGYIVIRYSFISMSCETKRLMETLGVLEYASFHDSFTYSGLSKRIVFVRSDVSETEYFYLLLLELGRILTHTQKTDNLIGATTLEQALASEFAYHVTDCANHGIIYNSFKFYPIKGTIILTSIIAIITISASTIYSGKISGNTDIYLDNQGNFLYSDTSVYASNNIVPDLSKVTDETTKVGDSEKNEENEPESSNTKFIIPQDERVYYATKKGQKYHLAGCSYISGRETIELNSDDIKSGNYSPCSRCFS